MIPLKLSTLAGLDRRSISIRRAPRSAALALACIALIASSACRSFPEERVPKMKVLIMDFEMTAGMAETPRAIRGWWFGARNIYQNPRSGTIFAERLSANLAVYPYVNLFSRVDLRYYFARKRGRLMDAYSYLDEDEIDGLLRDVPALDYARELGADKLISGRIVENYLSENRTIHNWKSKAHIKCVLIDVASGEEEWKGEYELTERFASQSTVTEEIARRAARDLKVHFRRKAMGKIR